MESNPDGDYYSYLNHITIPFESIDFAPLLVMVGIGNWEWLGIALCLVAIFLLLLTSAMVSGSEVAYFSLSPQQLKDLAKDKSTTSSKRILWLLSKPEELLATILITNNLVNVAIILIAFFICNQLIAMGLVSMEIAYTANTLISTFTLVLFGEVMPKVYATHYNLKLARLSSFPLNIFHRIARPFSRLLATSTSFIERKVDQYRSKRELNFTELNQAIDLVAQNSELGTPDHRDIIMLRGLVSFKEIAVKEIMCSRMDIFALEKSLPFDSLLEKIVELNYSRIPVYDEELDSIEGILYVKDLLEYLDIDDTTNFKWVDLVKDPLYVPETKKIDSLLKEFQQKRMHLAIVVDEYGGTSGLITMEDILEEIVGDIKDEYDDPDEPDVDYRKVNRHSYEFDGRTMLHDVCKVMKLDRKTFLDVEGDFESLAGLLLELEQKFPEKNDKIRFKRFLFTVLSTKDNRIEKVRITIRPSEVSEFQEAV